MRYWTCEDDSCPIILNSTVVLVIHDFTLELICWRIQAFKFAIYSFLTSNCYKFSLISFILKLHDIHWLYLSNLMNFVRLLIWKYFYRQYLVRDCEWKDEKWRFVWKVELFRRLICINRWYNSAQMPSPHPKCEFRFLLKANTGRNHTKRMCKALNALLEWKDPLAKPWFPYTSLLSQSNANL